MKRLHIKTYGCQMNVYDSERMGDLLRPLGYAMAERAEDADLVVLNTCHIREKAAEKVYSELGRLKAIRAERLEAGRDRSTIVVAGCVAQAEGAEIMARQPAVDLVVGPQAYHQLPELIARTARARGERLAADFAAQDKFDALTSAPREVAGPTAFLTVQEGCDKFCSFCVVPYRRRGGAGGDDPGPGLSNGADDGIDGAGPRPDRPLSAGRHHRDRDGAHHRASLGLRCAAERRGGAGPDKEPRAAGLAPRRPGAAGCVAPRVQLGWS